ncbi:MAG: branched-chain amino acid ABC transporter permease [Deltaproteobacteria bacterium]|nr:branched-chain amino acid ABC transporter permease [Deltaproteobacteria bacterium]
MGLIIQKLSPLFGLSRITFYYYFNFLIALIFTIATYNIISSYMGRAFIAIRDNDIAAEVIGVNLPRYKLLSFAVSSFYTGVQGGLYGLFLGYLEPNMFTFMEAITLFVAVIKYVHIYGSHHTFCGRHHRRPRVGGRLDHGSSFCHFSAAGIQRL